MDPLTMAIGIGAVSGLVSGWGAKKEQKAKNDQLAAQQVIIRKQQELKVFSHELTTFNDYISREAAGQQRLAQAMSMGGSVSTQNVISRFQRMVGNVQEQASELVLKKELDLMNTQLDELEKGKQSPDRAFWTNALSQGVGSGLSTYLSGSMYAGSNPSTQTGGGNSK